MGCLLCKRFSTQVKLQVLLEAQYGQHATVHPEFRGPNLNNGTNHPTKYDFRIEWNDRTRREIIVEASRKHPFPPLCQPQHCWAFFESARSFFYLPGNHGDLQGISPLHGNCYILIRSNIKVTKFFDW